MKSTSVSLKEPTASNLPLGLLHEYQDKKTKQKIDKHLNDINDTITEDDIRNINTDATIGLLNKKSDRA
jgi:hypothetical protein